jgi:hypothetical protein
VGLALVTRIPSLAEAQIAAGALRSGGIEAVVFDAAFGGMEAPVIEGLGGYRLMAPEEDVVEARASLKAIRSSPGLPLEPDESPWDSARVDRVRWQSKGMRIVAALFLGAPFLVWLASRLLR